jgi:hypothetical protein
MPQEIPDLARLQLTHHIWFTLRGQLSGRFDDKPSQNCTKCGVPTTFAKYFSTVERPLLVALFMDLLCIISDVVYSIEVLAYPVKPIFFQSARFAHKNTDLCVLKMSHF